MNTKNLLSSVIAAFLPLTVWAQTSPAQSTSPTALATAEAATASSSPAQATAAPDAAELTRLLKDFLAGASRNDLAMHDRFWAEDLVYTSSSGRRIGKADILRDVREESAPKPGDETTVYSAEEIRVQQYGTTAIVAFRLVGITTGKEGKREVANYLNSGTFLKRNGQWQAVCWQATKMPTKTGTAK